MAKHQDIVLKEFGYEIPATQSIVTKTNFALGNSFEDMVVSELDTVRIADPKELRLASDAKIEQLVKATRRQIALGTKIISSAPLCMPKNCTPFGDLDFRGFRGTADLLIREDIFKSMFIVQPPEWEESTITCERSKFKYCVVDVKFSTINLTSKLDRMKSCPNAKYYACQTAIYNLMLEYLTGWRATSTYIMGRKNKYVRDTEMHSIDRKSGLLGTILMGDRIIPTIRSSIEWIIDLRQNGSKWSLSPPSNRYLYPNMKSNASLDYVKGKMHVAKYLKELTLLWWCSFSCRNMAHDKGITTYDDERLNSGLMEYANSRCELIDRILCVNRGSEISHLVDKNEALFGWDENDYLEIFVDFETVMAIMTEDDEDILVLIGAYSKHDGYKSFSIDLDDVWNTRSARKKVIHKFKDYLRGLKIKSGKCIRLVHYSRFEPTIWSETLSSLSVKHMSDVFWFDLLELVHDTKLTVRGALNFSLKSIITALATEKLVDVDYSIYKDVENGLEAAYLLNHIYSTGDSGALGTIIEYNKLDCVAMSKILDFIRC